MEDFNFLKSVIKNLTPAEIVQFQKNISKNISAKTESSNLYSKLFYLTLNFPEISYSDAELRIYGKENKAAFFKLVNRLKEKALDLIILSENVNNIELFEKRNKEIFAIRKEFLQFDLLLSRGANMNHIKRIEKIIKKASEYEYYDILLMALYRLFSHLINHKETEKYKTTLKEIKYFEDCRTSFYKANLYYCFCTSSGFTKSQVQSFNLKLPDLIEEVQADFLRTKSKNIRYFLFYLEYSNYHNTNEHRLKIKTLISLYVFLKNEKIITSKYKIGNVLLHLANAYIDLYEFENSITNALEARKHFIRIESNVVSANEILFYGFYFSGSILKSTEIIKSVIINSGQNDFFPKFSLCKWKYYSACLKFINKEFRNSSEILIDVDVLERDKDRWNVAIRILQIMNQIELENFDDTDKMIDNLRKHIFTNTKGKLISKRDQLITRTLVSLSVHSYNFRKTFVLKASLFSPLESPQETETHWKIKSPELIVFQEWFRARMGNIHYDHKSVMEKMKKILSPPH